MKITKTNREGPAGSFTGKGSSFVKEKEPVKDYKKTRPDRQIKEVLISNEKSFILFYEFSTTIALRSLPQYHTILYIYVFMYANT